MKYIKNFLFIISSFLFLLSSVQSLHACACCADQGFWNRGERRLVDYEQDIIQNLFFQPGIFHEYSGDADGQLNLASYEAKLKWQGPKKALVELSSPEEKFPSKIVISLIDDKVQILEADIDLNPKAETPMTFLYKEFIFRANVDISGPLQKKLNKKNYRGLLILRGYGNNCLGEETFLEWRLTFEHFHKKMYHPAKLEAIGKIGK